MLKPTLIALVILCVLPLPALAQVEDTVTTNQVEDENPKPKKKRGRDRAVSMDDPILAMVQETVQSVLLTSLFGMLERPLVPGLSRFEAKPEVETQFECGGIAIVVTERTAVFRDDENGPRAYGVDGTVVCNGLTTFESKTNPGTAFHSCEPGHVYLTGPARALCTNAPASTQ